MTVSTCISTSTQETWQTYGTWQNCSSPAPVSTLREVNPLAPTVYTLSLPLLQYPERWVLPALSYKNSGKTVNPRQNLVLKGSPWLKEGKPAPLSTLSKHSDFIWLGLKRGSTRGEKSPWVFKMYLPGAFWKKKNFFFIVVKVSLMAQW